MDYSIEKRRLLQGWNTWDTYSAAAYARLPYGYGISVGLKEYLRGQYLDNPNIGKQRKDEEKIRPGLHAYDGSYTEMQLEWSGITFRFESAAREEWFVLKITCISNSTRFVPSAVIRGTNFWNREGSCERKGSNLIFRYRDEESGRAAESETAVKSGTAERALRAERKLSAERTLRAQQTLCLITGKLLEDSYFPSAGPSLCVGLAEPVRISIGKKCTPEEADGLLQIQKERFLDYAREKYGALTEEWLGMQTSLAWNLVYDAGNDRPLVNVSRLWNISRGGYGIFCWDNFFMGYMLALDNPALGRANAAAILNEVKELGFVPNGAMGNGRKSFDRSQPPVGSLCIREIYRLDPQKWFLEDSFENLLRWNRWWMKNRLNDGLLSWGSNSYDNRWDMNGINELLGAALESGLDNSPMYADGVVEFLKEKGIMELWDVGLNSLYLYDCEALADIASILEKKEEETELRERADAFRSKISSLWNEELGIYCNYRTDRKDFSTVLTPCNFYPMLTGVPTQEQFERMMRDHFFNPEEFYGEWILPSVSRNHPMYRENSYWRGRIWAPTNFLVYLGLRNYGKSEARDCLVRQSVKIFMQEWLEHGHVHENYNADNGYGDDVQNSDRNYPWGGLMIFMKLMEDGVIKDFGRNLAPQTGQ